MKVYHGSYTQIQEIDLSKCDLYKSNCIVKERRSFVCQKREKIFGYALKTKGFTFNREEANER